MKRISIGFIFACLAITVSYGIARADCGAHELTLNVAKLRAIEAMPLTLSNVYSNDSPRWFAWAGRQGPTLDFACPEDPPVVQQVQHDIVRLWLNALQLQDKLAIYRFAKSGQIADPAPCVRIYLDQEQAQFLRREVGWGASREIAPALNRNQYFAHVKALWLDLSRGFGVPLPPLASDSSLSPATRVRIAGLDREVQILQAHLPDGVQCALLR